MKRIIVSITAFLLATSVMAVSINSARVITEAEKWYVTAINASSGDLYNGDVVVWATTHVSTGAAVTTTATANLTGGIAGVWEVIGGTYTPTGYIGNVQIYGYNSAVKFSGSASIYDALTTSGTARYCISASTLAPSSNVGFALEAKTSTVGTIKAFIKAVGGR